MNEKIKSILILTIVLFISYSCAKIGMPPGGPKDIDPPKILVSDPPNHSTNFNKKKITINFDEYVQINALAQSFNASPPFKEKPEFKLKGKSLIIELKDDLRSNTSYNLNFGDGIADLNENNPLKKFQFVFSTGDIIDSMAVSGFIYDAITLTPVEGIQVLLFSNRNDSTPYKEIPDYAYKSEKDGSFTISNVKNGTYKIFALKDANNNFIFDQANEKIAFSDSLIIPSLKSFEENDTIKRKGKKDSIVIRKKTVYSPKNIKLYSFEEDYQKQYITNSDRPEKQKCFLSFNRQLEKDIEIKPLNFKPTEQWYYAEKNLRNDTIILWMKDSIYANMDTLQLQVNFPKKDKDGKLVQFSDTVKLKSKKKEKINKKNQKILSSLSLKTNINSNYPMDLFASVLLDWAHPIDQFDSSKFYICKIKDSTETRVKYLLTEDSISKTLIEKYNRKYHIAVKWEESASYKLKIYPGAFTDIYGFKNDTAVLSFKTQKKDFYGNLIFKMKNISEPTIVQLMDLKDNILKKVIINSDQPLKFENLIPQKYKAKIIYDTNNNGRWDTGKYIEKRQPEKVMNFSGDITIRSNWDLELDWKAE